MTASQGRPAAAACVPPSRLTVKPGVRFPVRYMGLRALDPTRADLRGDVPVETGGVATFLNDASGRGAVEV